MGCYIPLLVLLVNVFAIPTFGQEIYSSMAHINDQLTLIKQGRVLPELTGLIVIQEERLNKIKSLAKTLGELSGDEIRDPNFTVHHPLNAFRFIRNHSVIFNTTATEMLQEIRLYEEGRAKIDNLSQKIKTFHPDDLKGVLRGILLMQRTYNLTTSVMADGNFGGVQSEPLTAVECQDLMVVAYEEGHDEIAKEWRFASLDKIDEGDESTTSVLLFSKAAAATAANGNYKEALSLYSFITYTIPESRYHRHRLHSYIRLMKLNEMKDDGNQKNTTVDKLRVKHDACCQGNVPRLMGPPPKDLYCHYYDNNGHPLLLIQPAKRELISKDPHVEIYHDVISNRAMVNLKTLAKPKLLPSKVNAKEGSRVEFVRRSQSCFLPYKVEDVSTLYKLIEALTALKQTSYEKLHVVNYGVGGHYYSHHDYIQYKDEIQDNRIATFMVYMSDVEAGGGTAFPHIPEVIFPQKGSAVFWYNMNPNNTINYHTQHAACPVVVGNKWVGNVWIQRNNNEFTRPCPLDRDSKWK